MFCRIRNNIRIGISSYLTYGMSSHKLIVANYNCILLQITTRPNYDIYIKRDTEINNDK